MIRKQEIAFSRRNGVFIDIYKKSLNRENIISVENKGTILKNIETFGYTLDKEGIEALETLTNEESAVFYSDLQEVISKSVGYKEEIKPMYPNFPMEVMEKDESLLYINAIIHYLTDGEYMPEVIYNLRNPLNNNVKLKVLRLVNEEEIKKVFKNLLSATVSLSEGDKEDIEYIFNSYEDIDMYLPDTIEFKETLIYITNLYKENNREYKSLTKLYKTATDVLRLATALSGGDISLSSNTKFISFNKRDRRLILTLLEDCKNIEEDMYKYKNKWIRLGERIHPGEYKKFTKVNRAFNKLRNNSKINTFYSRLEDAFKANDTNLVLELLMKRPGEFARALDRVLRMCSSNKVIYSFGAIAENIATPNLLQLIAHFRNRNNSNKELRVFFPKGNVAKAYGINNNLEKLEENVCNKVVEICREALVSKYSERKNLGKVFIDEGLEDFLVPMSERTASKALKAVARGSRFNISEDAKVIRAFTYWKQIEGESVDLDLSAVFLNEKFEMLYRIAYYDLKNEKIGSCHSGDIVTAPEGAMEYVDIDIEKSRNAGIRYVLIMNSSFTCTPYKDLPEAFYGFMEREKAKTGEVYEAKTVKAKVDLTSDSMQILAFVLDLQEYKMIACDMPVKNVGHYPNNVDANKNNIALMLQSILDVNKPTLLDLFEINAEGRGIKVESKEEADIIFTANDNEEVVEGKRYITPYDRDMIMGEFI